MVSSTLGNTKSTEDVRKGRWQQGGHQVAIVCQECSQRAAGSLGQESMAH